MVLGIIGECLLGAGGCAQQNTYRDTAIQQHAAEARLRDQQLAPMIGTYCGSMQMVQSGVPYDVRIQVARADNAVSAPQASDPTVTDRVSKLVGGMRFPVMDDADVEAIHEHPDLVRALGAVTAAISIDNGDYTPSTGEFFLSFNVAKHEQGSYGVLRGKRSEPTPGGVHLSGTWYSNSYQSVGVFEVQGCDPARYMEPAGGSS